MQCGKNPSCWNFSGFDLDLFTVILHKPINFHFNCSEFSTLCWFFFLRWRPLSMLALICDNGKPPKTHDVWLLVSALYSNFKVMGFIVMFRFWHFGLNSYSHPVLGHISPLTSLVILTLKRTLFALKHVIWTMKDEDWSGVTSWARDEK